MRLFRIIESESGLLKDWRRCSSNAGSISTADGSALVRLGNTTVVCGVKAEIAEPELDAGNRGFLGESYPSELGSLYGAKKDERIRSLPPRRVRHRARTCFVKAFSSLLRLFYALLLYCKELTKGNTVPNLDLPAMCSPRFKPGPPADDAQVLSDRLNEALIA